MTLKELLQRELYVAIRAQSARFRIIKYILILAVFIAVYAWKGWSGVWWTFGIAFILAIATHFFFRYKSKDWNKAWGPYKPPFGKK